MATDERLYGRSRVMECHDQQYSEAAEERREIVQKEKEKEAEKKGSMKAKDQMQSERLQSGDKNKSHDSSARGRGRTHVMGLVISPGIVLESIRRVQKPQEEAEGMAFLVRFW